jgi:putative spermidine/putrescine transport system ATP-binding protein
MSQPAQQGLMSRKVGTSPTLKKEVLDLTPEEFAAVSSEIEPIIPRYDLYISKSDWINQKWTELIVGCFALPSPLWGGWPAPRLVLGRPGGGGDASGMEQGRHTSSPPPPRRFASTLPTRGRVKNQRPARPIQSQPRSAASDKGAVIEGGPMSGLALKDVTKRFGDFTAVDAISLAVPHGTFVCLLGPSGCGKTTLLRMIAGLEEPTAGAILLDDQDITPVPTHQRNLGMVFQSLALFPHLSVGDNISYSLRIRGASRDEQARRVDELLKMVHLPGFAERPVAKLSGGQRQRVAIARALAHSPKLFLLDEPLSALDAKLREAMQVELRQLQQQLGITTIVVTHDQREAMTMADLVVVMGNGKIRQAAAPIEIYRKPADAFVADFIGSTNLLDATADSGGRVVILGHAIPGLSLPAGVSKASVSIRPEDVHIAAPGGDTISGTVTFVRDLGGTIETFVEAGGSTIVAVATPRERPDVTAGQTVGVVLPPESCVVLTP